jgi:hypothetical protein
MNCPPWIRGKSTWTVGYDEEMPRTLLASAVSLLLVSGVAGAQIRRPAAELATSVDAKVTRPGSTAKLVLRVALPKGFHVQADKPRDPALIATVLNVRAPKGTTLIGVTYPKPLDLKQAGAPQPLAVFEEVFEITVRLRLAPSVSPGKLTVPATLRYQACNDSICFIPTSAETAWTLEVGRG